MHKHKLIEYTVTSLHKIWSATLLVILSFCAVSTAWAQRNMDYRELAMRNQQRPVSFDFITLPGDQDDTVNFTSIFSFSYSYLPFRKVNDRSSENNFFSTVNLSMEVFKSNQKAFNNEKFKGSKDISLEGLEPAGRSFWEDTAYAKSYDQSQSKEEFLSGYLSVSLPPGFYNYVLQMKRGEETDSRISRTQAVHIEAYDQMKVGNVITGQKLLNKQGTPQLHLTNMGNNVEYAEDFYALAYIPQYDADAKYTLKVSSLNVADRDTSKQREAYSQELTNGDIRTGLRPKITTKDNNTFIRLNSSKDGFAYALVQIPNSKFPNSLYRLTIQKDGQDMPVSRGTFRTIWIDMPTSLLSLDVSIDMLHYIVDKETIRNLSSGSQAQREKKFREFWEKRDPTPKTEFNELMAEYYRRIDYAYKNFSTENIVGYESDQGRIYIKYGPPKNIDRKFPTNGPTTEVWTYPNRQFVFKATTGFGDFKLVSDQSK